MQDNTPDRDRPDSLTGILTISAERRRLYLWMVAGAILVPIVVMFVAGGPGRLRAGQAAGSVAIGIVLGFVIWLRHHMSKADPLEGARLQELKRRAADDPVAAQEYIGQLRTTLVELSGSPARSTMGQMVATEIARLEDEIRVVESWHRNDDDPRPA